MRTSMLNLLLVAAGLLTGQHAEAQTPSTRSNRDESAARPIPPFERGAGKPIEPTPESTAGSEVFGGAGLTPLPDDLASRAGVVAPEGSYYPRVVGQVRKTSLGDLVFAPDERQPGSTSGADAPAAMVLLASMRRDQLAAALDTAGTDRFALGGQVMNYHGRGYLLLSTFAPVEEASKSTATQRAGTTDVQDARDEDVRTLIQELETIGTQQRTLSPGGVRSRTLSQEQSTLASLTEGSMLTNRRGRIVRKADAGGRLMFAFDNDADSPAPAPMLLLPCQTLEQLEGLVATRGEDVSVRITGRVLTSNGRPALLPMFFQVTRRTGLNSGQ